MLLNREVKMFNPEENNYLENEILSIDEQPILNPSDLCKQVRRKTYFSRKAISALIGTEENCYKQWEIGKAEPPQEFMEKLLAMNEFINSERKNLWEFVEELNRQRKNGSVFVIREINSEAARDIGSIDNLQDESLLAKPIEEIKKELCLKKKLLDKKEIELNIRETHLVGREKELVFKLGRVNDRLRKVNNREHRISVQEEELTCFAKNIKEQNQESHLKMRDSSYLKRLLS